MADLNIPVQQLRSVTAGAIPTTSQVLQGQIAINLVDRKIYTLDGTGAVQQIGVALSDLAAVAQTGSYTDLSNKPPGVTPYTLPPAQPETLGGVMVPAGGGLTLDGSGNIAAAVISVAGRTGVVVLASTDVGIPTDLLSGSSGTLATKYLPASVTGALIYQGTWNASTNVPILVSGVGTKGFYYVVSVAGTTSLDGNAVWNVGDWAIFDGTEWGRLIQEASDVTSINGATGEVTINAANLPNLSAVGISNSYADLSNIPSTFPPSAHTQAASTITGLATVATSGSYDDLLDLPVSPSIARLPVNLQGNPNLINEVYYLFAEGCQFPNTFANSQVFVELISGTTSTVRIMQYLAAVPTTGVQVGTINIDTVHGNSFTSVGSTTVYAAGDKLSYQFADTNISLITITLKGTWTS